MDKMNCLLRDEPHNLSEITLRNMIQGLYHSVGSLHKELSISESINIISSLNLKDAKNDLKSEKKEINKLKNKLNHVHRKKAMDVLNLKKENVYLHKKIKALKIENSEYKIKARDYLSRLDDFLTCVKLDLECRRKK